MSAAELRQAAETLRSRAQSVRRPYAQQEMVDEALADWLDLEAIAEERALRQYPHLFRAGEHAPVPAERLARLINDGAS